MSFFSGYTFFIYAGLALIPAIILGVCQKSLKEYRSILTVVFIWLVYKDSPKQLLFLLVYVVYTVYIVNIYLFLRKIYGRNPYIYGHAVLFALLPLLVSKIGGLYGKSIMYP